MRNKKIFDSTDPKLIGLTSEAKALYFTLMLNSDDAGIVMLPNNCSPGQLFELADKGLITVTNSNIILRGYISSNYGPVLKIGYGPYKSVFECIEKAGYTYNPESNEIEVPLKDQINDLPSLFKLCKGNNDTIAHQSPESPLRAVKMDQSIIITYLGSIEFALYLSIGLMTAQSIHSSYTLYNISHIPNPYNLAFAVFTAFILDFLVIFFTIRGKLVQTMVFFIFCSLMSLYSYHLGTEWFSYQSFFAMVVSFAVPYSVYSVSGMVANNNKSITQ